MSQLISNKVVLSVTARITNSDEDLPQNVSFYFLKKIIYAKTLGVLSINRKLSNVKCYLKSHRRFGSGPWTHYGCLWDSWNHTHDYGCSEFASTLIICVPNILQGTNRIFTSKFSVPFVLTFSLEYNI